MRVGCAVHFKKSCDETEAIIFDLLHAVVKPFLRRNCSMPNKMLVCVKHGSG